MIKILHLFEKLDKGGAELRTIESLKYYNKSEFEFHFLSLSGEEGYLDQSLIEKGYKIHYFKLKSILFPINFIKLLKKENINIIHSHIYYSSAIIVLLSKLIKNTKVISHFRTSGQKNINKVKKMRNLIFSKIIDKYSDYLIFVSKNTKIKTFKSISNPHSIVMYNGFQNKENMSLVRENITHVGRFNEAKNQLFLLNVMPSFKNETFFFIGDYDTEYGLEFIERIGSMNNIVLTGVTDSVDSYLQESKIFLFPSTREGLPGALIEAALNNNFILASDIEENIEVATLFPDQIKVLPLNPDIWKEELGKLLKSEMIRVSNNVPENLNIQTNINKMKEIYNELAHCRKDGSQ